MEGTAAGAVEVACIHACVLHRKHAESRWPHYTRHEHSPALYEGPWQPHTRSVYTHNILMYLKLTPTNLFRFQIRQYYIIYLMENFFLSSLVSLRITKPFHVLTHTLNLLFNGVFIMLNLYVK